MCAIWRNPVGNYADVSAPPEVIVALGGGSFIDTAKVLAAAPPLMIGHHLSIMGCRSRPRTPIRNVDFKGLIAWLFASEMLPPITALAGFGYVIVGASACLAVLGDLLGVPTTIALTGLFALLAIPPAVALRPFFPRWWHGCRDRPR